MPYWYCCELNALGLKLSIDGSPSSFGCTVTDLRNRALYSISEGITLSYSSREGRFAMDQALRRLCDYINTSVRQHLHLQRLPEVLTPAIFKSCFLDGPQLPPGSPWYLRDSELEVLDVSPYPGVEVDPNLDLLSLARGAAVGLR
jgi:hypothetical protein